MLESYIPTNLGLIRLMISWTFTDAGRTDNGSQRRGISSVDTVKQS